MARSITIKINADPADEHYADIANTLWMVMRMTPYDFEITDDHGTPSSVLQAAWDRYGAEDAWH